MKFPKDAGLYITKSVFALISIGSEKKGKNRKGPTPHKSNSFNDIEIKGIRILNQENEERD